MILTWYTLKDVQEEKDQDVLLAMGLTMWGNCHLENPPEDFGMMMVDIGKKLGVVATPENLSKLFEERFGKEE